MHKATHSPFMSYLVVSDREAAGNQHEIDIHSCWKSLNVNVMSCVKRANNECARLNDVQLYKMTHKVNEYLYD